MSPRVCQYLHFLIVQQTFCLTEVFSHEFWVYYLIQGGPFLAVAEPAGILNSDFVSLLF